MTGAQAHARTLLARLRKRSTWSASVASTFSGQPPSTCRIPWLRRTTCRWGRLRHRRLTRQRTGSRPTGCRRWCGATHSVGVDLVLRHQRARVQCGDAGVAPHVHGIVVGAVSVRRHHRLQDLCGHILKHAVLAKLRPLLGVSDGQLHWLRAATGSRAGDRYVFGGACVCGVAGPVPHTSCCCRDCAVSAGAASPGAARDD